MSFTWKNVSTLGLFMSLAEGVTHRRSQGGQKGHSPSNVLENIVIVGFEGRFYKQNCAIRLKSNILAPKKFLDWLHHWCYDKTLLCNICLHAVYHQPTTA